MAFTNDDDSGLEGNVDELLLSAIEENEKLCYKIISLKVEKEEAKTREDLLKNKLKEKEKICEKREAEMVISEEGIGASQKELGKLSNT